jgi:hypothetical protein
MRQVRVEQTRSLHDADIRGVIVMLRRQKVLLDADLARLYGVSTKRLNEQVRRNLERFPRLHVSAHESRGYTVEVANCDLKAWSLAQRLDELESRIESKLADHDRAIADIIAAIRELMVPPDANKRPIGFVTPK